MSIEISYKILAFGYAYLVHYTMLFHNWGGYYNSLILQALELLPGQAEHRISCVNTIFLFPGLFFLLYPHAFSCMGYIFGGLGVRVLGSWVGFLGLGLYVNGAAWGLWCGVFWVFWGWGSLCEQISDKHKELSCK